MIIDDTLFNWLSSLNILKNDRKYDDLGEGKIKLDEEYSK
jgi:hypothetical protein